MKRLLVFIGKTLLILAFLTGIAVLTHFPEPLNRISLYNHLFPGRERLPFGESPQTAYNFSIDSLDAAFASHKIHGERQASAEELRMVVIGDSSDWGTLLKPEETFCSRLDGKELTDGRTLRCYNLAYPTLSLSKDLLLLHRALEYEPDLVLWGTTLESFPKDKNGINNALTAANFTEYQSLGVPCANDETPKQNFSKIRRAAADWLRLQLYGVMWAGTGIDQDYPQDYTPPQTDFTEDRTFHGTTGALPQEMLDWELLDFGIAMAGKIPVLLMCEPMLISTGENSEIRYNYYYPRDTFDTWLADFTAQAEEKGWNLLDLHDLLPQDTFTNSAIHYNAAGAEQVAESILKRIELMILNGQL